jgi:Ca-activated chloride channel family protein
MGSIDPQSAAEIAELYGIRIYTIGVGTMGTALVPVRTQFGIQYQRMEVQIDEARLQKISALTNGKYFRATNKQKLEQVYKEIDRLEKSKIDVTEFSRKKEEFLAFVIFALVLLTLEFMIRFVVLKLVP